MMTTSGLTFTPWVSSSKKRSRPALEAGMGASRFRFFALTVSQPKISPIVKSSH